MDIQRDEQEQLQQVEIREAVADFARLALEMSVSASQAVSQPAVPLLKYLLSLCQAHYGALFLMEDKRSIAGQHVPLATAGKKRSQILARHGLGEEEAHTLLSSFLPLALPAATVKTASGTSCRALCHLPTSAPTLHHEAAQLYRDGTPLLFSEAWLLLGWVDKTDEICEALLARANRLLTPLAAPAGAVLLSLLRADRIRELEAATYERSVREMELLKAELLATVSHELRSPLASIKGYTGTLLRYERRISAEERHEFLLAIQQASDRLQFIVDRFLEMSRLETESVKLSPVLTDALDIVQEAISAVEERVSGHTPGAFTFHIHVRNAAGQPANSVPLIDADPRLLREVLDHLLENAVSYSPNGGRVEVLLQPVLAASSPGTKLQQISETKPETSKEGISEIARVQAGRHAEMLEIRVHDRGMGIASEHLERVFDRFYRVDTALTRSVGGLGLGLAISKQIVELHHGIIWAEERPGGGAAFSIRLPITFDKARIDRAVG